MDRILGKEKVRIRLYAFCSIPESSIGIPDVLPELFSGFMELEDMGIFTACYEDLEKGDILKRLYEFGKGLLL